VQYTRIAAAAVAALCSVVLVATLSGCATESAGSSALAVSKAKQRTIALEKSIAAYVPKSKVLSTNITKTSKVIFPCLGKNGKSYWPGSGTLRLKSGVNTDAVLTALSSKWNDKAGWSAYVNTTAAGNKSLSLKTSDGYSFTAEFDQGPVFSISALSACFASSGLTGKSSY
jgi:hypothetical protein